jgi:hypothetical protein
MRGFGMNWVRRHIRNGSKLALFALAIQMMLAFGHYHAGHTLPAPHGASIELAQLPSGPTQDQHAADHCDICGVVSMAGTMLAAAPPQIALPPITGFVRVAATAAFRDLATIDVAFQPRAPPLS